MVVRVFEEVRMLDCPDIPVFTVHGTRHLELLPGGYVCAWQCEDYLDDTATKPLFCVPVVKLVIPIQNVLWNARAVSEWASERGLTKIPMRGPNYPFRPFGTRH